MSTPYAGNPASYPTSYNIPSDGDLRNAASVNVALEALGDRTAFLLANLASMREDVFSASGTWKAPDGCTAVLLIGWGGGGGGAGGNSGLTTTNERIPGGGGGGGSRLYSTVVAVTPGTTYTVTIGAGGAGGAATVPGSDGASTTFGALATFSGGGKGYSTNLGGVGTTGLIQWGGTDAPDSIVQFGSVPWFSPSSPGTSIVRGPSWGGPGSSIGGDGASGFNGVNSPQGKSGGAGGVHGNDGTGSYLKGFAGGGGGGGPGGAGGTGGNGGNGGTTATGTSGTAGGNAGANSGGGGGGGGGGGNGSVTSGTGGAGGNGGSGKLVVCYIASAAAVVT